MGTRARPELKQISIQLGSLVEKNSQRSHVSDLTSDAIMIDRALMGNTKVKVG